MQQSTDASTYLQRAVAELSVLQVFDADGGFSVWRHQLAIQAMRDAAAAFDANGFHEFATEARRIAQQIAELTAATPSLEIRSLKELVRQLDGSCQTTASPGTT